MTQAQLIAHYEDKLEKVRKFHGNDWRYENYVRYAEQELEAVKTGGMDGLRRFYNA